MATLKDVANEVGVSVATVSYVLNGTGSVSQAVKNKVNKAVAKLGYRPNRRAQAMRTGVTKSIGLILPDLTNPFFPELAQKVETAARKKGFIVLLFDTQNEPQAEVEVFNILEQHGVDGIIWCPVSKAVPKTSKSMSCPIVVVDRPIGGFDVVQSDYKQGGVLLAEYVGQSGHVCLGLLSGPGDIESACQRRDSFVSALPDGIDIVWDVEVPFSMELTSDARSKLNEDVASLIVCGDDVIAVGAIKELNAMGLRVPEDVSVVGFDNIPWSTVVKPQLTTISQPLGALGAEAFKLLVTKMAEPEQTTKKIILDVELVVRESVAKPRGGMVRR